MAKQISGTPACKKCKRLGVRCPECSARRSKAKPARYEPGPFRSAEEAARDHDALAIHYAKLADDDLEFNKRRGREGKPAVESVTRSAQRHRAKANWHRARAKKLRSG
jgi:hypothetical protein